MSPDCAQDDNNGVILAVYCWVIKLPRIELSVFLYERWKSVGLLNVYSTSIKAYITYSVRFLKLMHYICCVWVLCLRVWSYRYSSKAIIFGIHADSAFISATAPIIKFTENLYLTIGVALNPSSCPAPLCDPTDKRY